MIWPILEAMAEILKNIWLLFRRFEAKKNCFWDFLTFSRLIEPPIYLYLIFLILQFEISCLMNLIFSIFQTWILQATAGRIIQFKLGKKNLIHQTRYFKLENCKNQVFRQNSFCFLLCQNFGVGEGKLPPWPSNKWFRRPWLGKRKCQWPRPALSEIWIEFPSGP